MNWDLLDFLVFFGLVAAAGIFGTLLFRKSGDRQYRAAAAIATLSAALLFFANGAVGIIGNENNDANMLYLGVLGILVVGSLLARFEASAMAFVMLATAAGQILVPVIALLASIDTSSSASFADVIWLTMFFSALWLLSAWLFGRAGTGDTGDSIPSSQHG